MGGDRADPSRSFEKKKKNDREKKKKKKEKEFHLAVIERKKIQCDPTKRK